MFGKTELKNVKAENLEELLSTLWYLCLNISE